MAVNPTVHEYSPVACVNYRDRDCRLFSALRDESGLTGTQALGKPRFLTRGQASIGGLPGTLPSIRTLNPEA